MQLELHDLGTGGLVEDSQTIGMRLALGIKKGTKVVNITPWMMCRDYFNDILWVQHSGYDKEFRQYGLRWNYNEDLARDFKKKERIRLLVRMPQNKSPQFEKKKQLIWSADKFIGAKKTLFRRVPFENIVAKDYYTGSNNIYQLFVDKKWFSNSPLFSLYTLLLRLMPRTELDPYNDFLNAFVKLRDKYQFTDNTSDGGLVFDIMKNPEIFLKFMRLWETRIGWDYQPYSEQMHKENADAYESFTVEIHNGSGIAAMIHGMGVSKIESASACIRGWVQKINS